MTGAPVVVLLHGLARSKRSMHRMAAALHDAQLEVFAVDYPSRTGAIAELTSHVTDAIVGAHPGRDLCAVTHSLGGIIFRHLHDPRLRWQRAVMLAPPNRGSQIAAAFGRHPLFRSFYGAAGQELAGRIDGWPPPPAPVAIIAGTRRRALINPTSWVSSRVFAADQAHDGTVAVDETVLDGAVHRTVDATHTTIMDDPRVQALTIAFLRDGVMPVA